MPTSPRRPSPQFPQQDTAGASRATRAPGAEVLILGGTASGKTTFLTVLGHKFAESGVFNLGLTEVPGTGTLRFVDESWHRMTAPLAERDFPPATDPGEEAESLFWDVDVGDQTLFRLSTFDCAGETIYSVFTETPDEDGRPASGGTLQEQQLRSLAKRANVLCLFLRPGDLEAGRRSNATSAARERARKTKETLLAVARGPAGEGKELLFVLTDSHAYEADIASKGGPVSWLLDQIPQLKRAPRARNAHVFTVSAVNETEKRPFQDQAGTEKVREVPAANFTSSGLETFLVCMGGIISPVLRPLGKALLSLQEARRLWALEKQFPNPASVGERFRLSRNFTDAAAEFQRAADNVLSRTSPDSIVRDKTQRFILEATLEARRTDVLEKALQTMLNECAKIDPTTLRGEAWWEEIRALALKNAEAHRPGGTPYDRTELPEASAWYMAALEEARHRGEEEARREEERLKEEKTPKEEEIQKEEEQPVETPKEEEPEPPPTPPPTPPSPPENPSAFAISFRGRIGRKGAWATALVLVLMAFIFGTLVESDHDLLATLSGAYAGIWFLSLLVRRSHDFGASGWCLTLLLIVQCFGYQWTLASVLLTIVLFLFYPGRRGPNKYGPDPRKKHGQ